MGSHGDLPLISRLHLERFCAPFAVVFRQFFFYAFFGVALNVAGYILYLCLTTYGLDPKVAATIGFPIGVAAGFLLNRRWTFGVGDRFSDSASRYVSAYVIAYAVNIAGLYLFVDVLRYPHQIVQIILILLIACGLFAAQKFWIFSDRRQDKPITNYGNEQAHEGREFPTK